MSSKCYLHRVYLDYVCSFSLILQEQLKETFLKIFQPCISDYLQEMLVSRALTDLFQALQVPKEREVLLEVLG